MLIKLMTLEGEDFLLSAYPCGGRLRLQVSMTKEGCACLDGEAGLLHMARELTEMALCAARARAYMTGEAKEGK